MVCPNGPSSNRARIARSKSVLLTSAGAANGVPLGEAWARAPAAAPFGTGAAAFGMSDAGRRALRMWRLVGLLEIRNFASLRRLLGIQRADRLTSDIAETISAHHPAARCSAIGRATLEWSVDLPSRAEGETLLGALQAVFAVPVPIDGDMHRIELVLAGAICPIVALDEVKLAEEAEEALDVARAEQGLVLRDMSTATPGFDRLSLIRDLGSALANGEMFIQYQPKLHLRRQEVSGAEALIRWQHPTRGLVFPGDFIPAAEESRQIGPLTLWTLEQVIADQRRLAAQGYDIPLSINISGQLLGDAQFVASASALIRQSGARIGFEITETSVIRDPETAIAHLHQFDELGIPIAIDDYGAGLSSLAYLKQLPARELKIDKMFVLQLTSSNRDPLIVRSTIDLAHALEMEVTAEGVESQAALALLSVMGCDIAQGFLISRPISIEALRLFIDDTRGGAMADPLASFSRPANVWKSA